MIAPKDDRAPQQMPQAMPFAQLGFPEGVEYLYEGVELRNVQASIERVSGIPFGALLPDWKIRFEKAESSWELLGDIVIARGDLSQDLLLSGQSGQSEYAFACGSPILRSPAVVDPRVLQVFVREQLSNVALHLLFTQLNSQLQPEVGVSASVHAMIRGYAALPPSFDASVFLKNVHSGYIINATEQ